MKARLTKDIKLKCAIAYLCFEREEKRPDISKFLKGEVFENEIVNKRVKEYLKSIGVYDHDYNMTKAGDRVLETGKIFVREEGKYKVWFVEKDLFLNTKILYFERVKPKAGDDLRRLDLEFPEDNTYLPVGKEAYSELRLIGGNTIDGQLQKCSDKLRLHWSWDGLKSSKLMYDGNIKGTTISKHSIVCDKVLEKEIKHVFGNWDAKTSRVCVKPDDLTIEELYDFQQKELKVTNFEGFQGQFLDVNIQPDSLESAVEWRDCIIKYQLEKGYISPYDFEKVFKRINETPQLSKYTNKDNNASNFVTVLNANEGHAKQSKAFWHLSAPNDLNPDRELKYVEKSIECPVEEQMSFKDIVKRLLKNSPCDVSAIFYYDKYTHTESQQQKMRAFFDAFEHIAPEKKYLLTLLNLRGKGNRSSYLKKNTDINLLDLNQEFGQKLPHNRYIILAEDKGNYAVWQIPSSIDYISFSDNVIEPQSEGRIVDSTSFHLVKKEMLKSELRTFIEKQL